MVNYRITLISRPVVIPVGYFSLVGDGEWVSEVCGMELLILTWRYLFGAIADPAFNQGNFNSVGGAGFLEEVEAEHTAAGSLGEWVEGR